MMWFKVDDDLAFHRKTVAAGNAAMGLWVRAGSWCGQQLSDGRIPAEVARTMGRPSEIKALVRVGLWEIDGDFYVFHDFFVRNPSRAEVEAKRAAEAKKKAEWRAKHAGQKGLSTGDTTGDNAVDSPEDSPGPSPGESRSTRPDPTRPASKEVPTTSGRQRPRPPVEPNAGNIVALWIESLDRRPPTAVIGQVSKHIKALLTDGFAEREILDGLAVMGSKGLNPSTLPSLVNDVVNRPKLAAVPNSRAGMVEWVEVNPGYWQEAHPDGFYVGKRSKWLPAGQRPA